jgi:hypothetical protein
VRNRKVQRRALEYMRLTKLWLTIGHEVRISEDPPPRIDMRLASFHDPVARLRARSAATFCAFSPTWYRRHSRPVMQTLQASARWSRRPYTLRRRARETTISFIYIIPSTLRALFQSFSAMASFSYSLVCLHPRQAYDFGSMDPFHAPRSMADQSRHTILNATGR